MILIETYSSSKRLQNLISSSFDKKVSNQIAIFKILADSYVH